MIVSDDLDFGDLVEEELSAGSLLDAIRSQGVKGVVTASKSATAGKTVVAQPTAKATVVRKGTIPGAVAGALVGGVPGALLGGMLGHAVSRPAVAVTSPVAQQIVRAVSPSINRIQADLRRQALQQQATLEHRQINRRDEFQRTLLDKVNRIERMIARPYMRSL